MAIVSPLWTGLPWGLASSIALTIVAAAVLVVAGIGAGQRVRLGDPQGNTPFAGVAFALAVAGSVSGAIGLLQVLAPSVLDGEWISQSASPGRAAANLRQPNHLATLLLWGAVAAVWGHHSANQRPTRFVWAILALWCVVCVTLTSSRTGAVGTVMLGAWGLLDRKLGRSSRALLVAAPIAFVIAWGLLALGEGAGAIAFIGPERLQTKDISNARFAIWANTVDLIAAHPYVGVGVGEFNFAWTLSPFDQRPPQFFDHAHNLPLHLMTEMGIPLGALALILLARALWVACQSAHRAGIGFAAAARSALVMLLLAVLHSLVEYPLWYAYFLMPTAFMWGICLGCSSALPIAPRPERSVPTVVAAMLVAAGGGVIVWDYAKVTPIYAPTDDDGPLFERIAAGQRSWFFTHHADYALATTASPPEAAAHAFDRPTHYLLDARLMMAWVQALAAVGDVDRARYIAQRLREFRHEQAHEFFATCGLPAPAASRRPFQCDMPARSYSLSELRARRVPE